MEGSSAMTAEPSSRADRGSSFQLELVGSGRSLAAALCLTLSLSPRAAGAEEQDAGAAATPDAPVAQVKIPPVNREALRPRAPSPAWDLGWSLGAGGLGRDALFQTTEFYLSAHFDVSWLRHRETDLGLGLSFQVATLGFLDGRYATRGLLALPLNDWLIAEGELGPLLVSSGSGLAPGVSSSLALGLRALNPSAHYGMHHALVFGFEAVPGDSTEAGTALTLALRIDAVWVAVPFGILF